MTARSKGPDNPAADQDYKLATPTGNNDLMPPSPYMAPEVAALNPVRLGELAARRAKRQRDPELVAMEQLTRIFEAMPEYCKRRVISWLTAKYGGGPQGEVPPQTWENFLPTGPARP